jgi:long-subunit acyl-CoA synthetase (AMP-forming)
MLSHTNIDWACRALHSVIARDLEEAAQLLPLCHIAERAPSPSSTR